MNSSYGVVFCFIFILNECYIYVCVHKQIFLGDWNHDALNVFLICTIIDVL